ncbi:MAG: SRPBCC family protein [Gemmatimonadaceae bacterium]|nr:SRPBCC family protein [Gemmatimonadaceae bacterium]
MIKKILLGLCLVVLAVLVYATFQPDSFALERRTTINASPDSVFAHINDFHRWDEWSPWAKLDPNMKVTHGGPPAGSGAVYGWTGNSDVGEGRMTITESVPPSKVVIALDFIAPMEANNITTFTLTPNGAGTDVVWRMEGPMNYLSKLMCVFISMERLIGPDFEKGLAQLKTAVEQ